MSNYNNDDSESDSSVWGTLCDVNELLDECGQENYNVREWNLPGKAKRTDICSNINSNEVSSV
jgi:hypothetical protein